MHVDADYSSFSVAYSLCYGRLSLHDFRTSYISIEMLDRISSHLSALKESGTKIIIRIQYANDRVDDASLEWIKNHLQQLQPIFAANSDIIAWFEAGIIGI